VPWWPVLVLWPGLCGPVLALELFEGFQVHGFLSQGYFKTSANNIFGNSDESGSLDFTEIGINASWIPLPRLQLSTQLISRRAGEGADGEVELDVGLADYSFLETAEARFGVRLGRVRLPLGLYNDTRDVPFARPSILLPQSVYPDAARTQQLSADGGMIYGAYHGTWGDLSVELAGVLLQVHNLDTEINFFFQDLPGELDPEPSFIGRMIYEYDGGRLRLAVSGLRAETNYEPRLLPPDDLTAGTNLFEPVIFSAQYNAERWSFTAEYELRFDQSKGFGPLLPDNDIVGEGYYAQAIYRLDPHWEAVLRYDVLYHDRDDRDGTEFKAETGFPANLQFAKDWTVGLRYNITSSLMVRAEYHGVYGTGWVSIRDNDPSMVDKQWDIFALLVSYRF